MGWNEPGNGKDPWGKPPGGHQPDLDELIKRLRSRFGGEQSRSSIIAMLSVATLLTWLLSGFYTVEPTERGVEFQFGKYSGITEKGLHWHLPYPAESVTKLDVEETQTIADRATLLTRDQNILELGWNLQYRISDARKYLSSTAGPEDDMKEAARSALRDAVASGRVDDVFYEGREGIAAAAKTSLQAMLNSYQSGIDVVNLQLSEVQPPQPVQPAFAEVTKVREEGKAKLAAAQAYASSILPEARGEAMRQVQEAEGYRSSAIARAKGETARFLAVLAQYDKAPQVTRKRLYLDAMESILSKTSKIVVDTRGSNPTIYLPIEQMLRQAQTADTSTVDAPAAKAPEARTVPPAPAKTPPPAIPEEDYRSRERAP